MISTATTSPKVMAVSARPDVALTIDSGNAPDQAGALSMRGQAIIEIVDGVVPEYLAAARKTMDAEAAAEFEQNVRGMYDRMARIAITPRWVRFYDFGAGRMPLFPPGAGRAAAPFLSPKTQFVSLNPPARKGTPYYRENDLALQWLAFPVAPAAMPPGKSRLRLDSGPPGS